MAVQQVNYCPKHGYTEFPKIWEYRINQKKNLSRWTKDEVPSFKLVGHLDTDHWSKLKKKHVDYTVAGKLPREIHGVAGQRALPLQARLPEPSSGIQRHYYEQGRKREDLLKKTFTMYQQDLLVDDQRRVPVASKHVKPSRFAAQKHPSIYHQHAKDGFQFWMDRDPILNKISFCSKYSFGSKHTFHGLGTAPRN